MKMLTYKIRTVLMLGVLGGALSVGMLWIRPSGGVAYAAALRPTLMPLPAQKVRTLGAYIELRAPEAAGLRAGVQWQGVDGAWHDVEGWRSELTGAAIEWWVAPGDFGKGPFRWVAYGEDIAAPRFVSEAFRLPNNHADRTIVTLK
ncbi:MAG: hypothetical protein NTZ50_00365 [Chloroflexi bacterium]|nr:hypothetical protein [Chloroflexota bacterium]